MLLGLDIGQKRTGVAISQGQIAHEYATIPTHNLSKDLLDICQQESIAKVIIGLPLLESGDQSEQTALVLEMSGQLKTTLKLPIEYVNEQLTTSEAKRILAELGVKGREADERLDQFAAQLILQQYIDENHEDI